MMPPADESPRHHLEVSSERVAAVIYPKYRWTAPVARAKSRHVLENQNPAEPGAPPADPAYAATPLAALELPDIPTELHFVRDHFPVPPLDPATWSLEVSGSAGTTALDLDQLRSYKRRSLRVVLECAGHRRIEMTPLAPGLPWGCGAVSEACWNGVSLSEVLARSGVPAGAGEVVLEGADSGGFPGVSGTHAFARSLPLAKALEEDVLVAFEMNGAPIPVERGGPVRAIVPGWYATDSVKWLKRLWFSSTAFDGPFEARDYRLQVEGEPAPGRRMTSVPIHALITSPAEGQRLTASATIARGIAWGGDGAIVQVTVQVDDGPWRVAELTPPRGRYARTWWSLPLALAPGTHTLACRASDAAGNAQPERPPSNLGGYANNAVHRVRVTVG